jgi:glutathione S-transferase
MIKLYGAPRTSASRCYWCLEEIGLKYEAVSIDLRHEENKSPEFLKLNPNGKVPVLVDGDLTLWESMAINFYLGDQYKQDLIGSLVKDRAYIRQWSYWTVAELQPSIIDILIQMKFVPEAKRDIKLIEDAKNSTLPKIKILDDALSKNNFLVANRFTLADLNAYSVVDIAKNLGIELTSFKNLMKWSEKISNRPSYQKLQELRKA